MSISFTAANPLPRERHAPPSRNYLSHKCSLWQNVRNDLYEAGYFSITLMHLSRGLKAIETLNIILDF